jgi:hypothetical protein
MIWQCRWSPTIGELEATHQEVWGTDEYIDDKRPTVFFGLYGLPDFYVLWRHKGKRAILWAGSDIRHFRNGYWLDEKGEMKLAPAEMAKWINKNCESWCENKIEQDVLKGLGIEANVCPSFLGDVRKFTPQKIENRKRYYSSVSGNDFGLYGWEKINEIAKQNPDTEYYLYGNTLKWEAPFNVIIRGRISKEQMNEECKSMTGAIRMVEFEGCSEIIVKSVLWGQKPISLIDYPFLKSENQRDELLKVLNNFPWNRKK